MAMSKSSNANLEDLKRRFCEWCRQQDRKTFSLLITGKTGTGKSSLVNALVGEPVAKEGDDKDSSTYEVTSYDIDIKGVKIRLWDSPGLRDYKGNDEKYLAEMERKIPEQPDLVIFCFKMDDTRFRCDDGDTFSKLTEHFGTKLWGNVVIALTFANKVDHPRVPDHEKKDYFLKNVEGWRKKITSFLSKEINLNPELIESLPIVPTGYYHPLTVLPDGGDWLSEFWTACFKATRGSRAICLYKINSDRVQFPGSKGVAGLCGGSKIALTSARAAGFERPPINLNEEQQESFWTKMWEMFTSSVAVSMIATVGIAVLKSLWK